MSIEAVALVLRAQTGLGTQAKMVLLGLADHARADGTEARPSIRKLAQYAECSERTVQRHLRTLEEHGFLSVQREADRAKHRPRIYRLSIPHLAALRPDDAPSPGAQAPTETSQVAEGEDATTRQDVTRPPVTVTPGGAPGDNGDAARVTSATAPGDRAVSPEPSLEPSLEPSQTPSGAPRRDRDEVFDDLAEIFGSPVNDADGDRRNRAVKLCRQAGWVEGELTELHAWAGSHPERWVRSLGATDMALAVNLGRLRRMRDDADRDPVVAELERRRAAREAS